ncbi:hypothetical protein PILCRDRAFT_658025 [Piloderma croceum F 1598]|uniref:Uncharacterized protein n=1 Tax=Piloderma croceum (strain F 1598) TaxID=765440 RepID=A0A0C3EU77_PILCF|nr:hypothetical protein PILCRDRAFT_658025 [Piloderma croceum F 1598]
MRSQLIMLALGAIAAVAVPVSNCSDCDETGSANNTDALIQNLVTDFVAFNNATAELASAVVGLGGANSEAIKLALDELIQAATELATDAQVLNSQGSPDPTDPTALAGHLIIQDIANFSIANAHLSATLAGPNGVDNQTVTAVLDNAISSIIKLADDTVEVNVRRGQGNITNNA